jgi:hypothetical protein
MAAGAELAALPADIAATEPGRAGITRLILWVSGP